MTDSLPHVVNVKNQWLFDQVEVEFPTPESLRGRAVYQSLCECNTVSSFIPADKTSNIDPQEIYLVDFHRLTVMFSLLQATRADNEQDQNDLVEFFTQIIFSQPCRLYVGFYQATPVAAAIVTESDDQLLVSDIVIKSPDVHGSKAEFATSVINKLNSEGCGESTVYIEL